MKIIPYKKSGDYYRALFTSNDDDFLFNLKINDSVLAKWGINTKDEATKLNTATILGERIAAQSAVIKEDKEDYIFHSYNTRHSLKETLDNFPY